VRRGALGQIEFRLLFLGHAISVLGDRLVPVALAFAVLDLTGSVGDLGIVMAAQRCRSWCSCCLVGVWADRLSRQRVMLVSDGVRATAQGVSAVLFERQVMVALRCHARPPLLAGAPACWSWTICL
jgi:hypothetical protein